MKRPSRAPAVLGKRKQRSPQHHFQLRTKPFAIQPFMIAPVLPGETLTNLTLRARVVSDPIVSPLTGWWQEYYLFYVKHRDLDERDLLTEMMLDPDVNLNAMVKDNRPKVYHRNGVDFVTPCLKRVVEEYFRNEGESWNGFLVDGLPCAAINSEYWTQSLVLQSKLEPPEDVAVDADGDGHITASEVDKAMRMWTFQRDNNLTDMDYEDFLATYGVRTPAAETHKPELIRYLRNWTYPTNTVDPATGRPSSAAVWSIEERADKNRFFKEPGFIFGVTVTRPKVFSGCMNSAGVSIMNDAMSWLPAIMMDDPMTSLKLVDNVWNAPLQLMQEDYYVDVKDLFVYGDQFINFDPTTALSKMNLPTPDTQRRYPFEAEVTGLFVDAGASAIRSDGIVQLGIRSYVEDTSPGTVPS